MKKVLLTILNIIGYLSILSLLLFAINFVMIFHTAVKVVAVIVLILCIIFNIDHYKKTKIKYFGIRIMISIIILFVFSIIFRYSYGFMMNAYAKQLGERIDKIVCEEDPLNKMNTYELDHETIVDSISFINVKYPIVKTEPVNATIYYKDGKRVNTEAYSFEGIFLIEGKQYRIIP